MTLKEKITLLVLGAVPCIIALYFLTAPLMLDILWTKSWHPRLKDRAYTKTWSWRFYTPATAAITRDWSGRDLYDWYCYRVCHMGLLLTMEASSRDFEQ